MIKCVIESVEGFSHKKRNQPCQDAVEKYIDSQTNTVLLAVADGHGNQMHRYSADGSRIAVQCALDVLKKALAEEDSKAYILSHMQDFPKVVETAWKSKIKEFHYHLVEAGEREIVMDRNSNKPMIDNELNLNILYGTTLLAAYYCEDFSFYMQIGDGDTTYVDEEGKCSYMIASEEQIGSATNSLCMVNSSQYFRIRFVDHKEEFKPILVFLSTDGYSNSYRSESDFLHLVGEYVAIMHNHSGEEVERVLSGWLNETSKLGSGDDISVAILYNDENKLCGGIGEVEVISNHRYSTEIDESEMFSDEVEDDEDDER